MSLKNKKKIQLIVNFVVQSETPHLLYSPVLHAVKIRTKNLLNIGANKIQIFGCEEPMCLEIPGTKIANSKCLLGSQIQEVDGNCSKVFIGRMVIFKVVGLSHAFKAVYNINNVWNSHTYVTCYTT